MIARYGPDAVAGFGVASRVESMMLVIYYAMSSVIGPFVGQNLSAGNEKRILRALFLCTLFCIRCLLNGIIPPTIHATGSSNSSH